MPDKDGDERGEPLTRREFLQNIGKYSAVAAVVLAGGSAFFQACAVGETGNGGDPEEPYLPPYDATVIVIGDPVTVELDSENDTQYFKFDATDTAVSCNILFLKGSEGNSTFTLNDGSGIVLGQCDFSASTEVDGIGPLTVGETYYVKLVLLDGVLKCTVEFCDGAEWTDWSNWENITCLWVDGRCRG